MKIIQGVRIYVGIYEDLIIAVNVLIKNKRRIIRD